MAQASATLLEAIDAWRIELILWRVCVCVCVCVRVCVCVCVLKMCVSPIALIV